MPQEYIHIGCTPLEEPCAQIGVTADAQRYNKIECRAYIAALRKKFGDEPEGARLTVKSESHDFGTYREVICFYNLDDVASVEYAYRCETGLETWDEVGMEPPVRYDEQAQPVIPEVPEFLIILASVYFAGFDRRTGAPTWEISQYTALRYPKAEAEALATRFQGSCIVEYKV